MPYGQRLAAENPVWVIRGEREAEPINQKGDKLTTRHPIIFAGAGPGDPDLITVKGQAALAAADLVIYAGSLVPEAVLKWAAPETKKLNSAGMHLAQIVDAMATAYREGRRVVRLHTGDPSLYGAIYEQMAQLDRQRIPYEVIPGVTAAFAAAATLGIEFTLPEVSQTLILTRMAGRTPVPEAEALESLAAHGASMAIYLSMSMIGRVAEVLQSAYGPAAACAVVYRASHPDEKVLVTRLKDLAKAVDAAGIRRQAVILVGKVLEVGKEKLTYKSKLYDKGFEHGYRQSGE
jgi:precorrin-4/cobalt-precorrin-4 C11-methyltransferase